MENGRKNTERKDVVLSSLETMTIGPTENKLGVHPSPHCNLSKNRVEKDEFGWLHEDIFACHCSRSRQ